MLGILKIVSIFQHAELFLCFKCNTVPTAHRFYSSVSGCGIYKASSVAACLGSYPASVLALKYSHLVVGSYQAKFRRIPWNYSKAFLVSLTISPGAGH